MMSEDTAETEDGLTHAHLCMRNVGHVSVVQESFIFFCDAYGYSIFVLCIYVVM